MNIKIGSDPEFFAVDSQGNAISPALLVVESGLDVIGGDVKHPLFYEDSNLKVIGDGVAFELTNKKPFDFDKPLEMKKNVANGVSVIQDLLNRTPFYGEKLKVFTKPTVSLIPEFYYKYLDSDFVHAGFIFGCDKDWDAYHPEYESKTQNYLTYPFRNGGGHLHFSTDNGLLYDLVIPMIKFLSITVGNYCLLNSPHKEEEEKRVTNYGMPGRYRPQNYTEIWKGLEYRSPSNSWNDMDDETFLGIFSWAEKAFKFASHPELFDLVENLCEKTEIVFKTFNLDLSQNILKEVENVGI